MSTKQKTVYCCDKCGIEVDLIHPFEEGETVQEVYCSGCGLEIINNFIDKDCTVSPNSTVFTATKSVKFS